jgi:transposase-like protein
MPTGVYERTDKTLKSISIGLKESSKFQEYNKRRGVTDSQICICCGVNKRLKRRRICRSCKSFGRATRNFKILEILEIQRYKCLICDQEFTDSNLPQMDHDHKNNKFRGYLCGMCNKGLGHFKDDIGILENAIRYLKWHRINSFGVFVKHDRLTRT